MSEKLLAPEPEHLDGAVYRAGKPEMSKQEMLKWAVHEANLQRESRKYLIWVFAVGNALSVVGAIPGDIRLRLVVLLFLFTPGLFLALFEGNDKENMSLLESIVPRVSNEKQEPDIVTQSTVTPMLEKIPGRISSVAVPVFASASLPAVFALLSSINPAVNSAALVTIISVFTAFIAHSGWRIGQARYALKTTLEEVMPYIAPQGKSLDALNVGSFSTGTRVDVSAIAPKSTLAADPHFLEVSPHAQTQRG